MNDDTTLLETLHDRPHVEVGVARAAKSVRSTSAEIGRRRDPSAAAAVMADDLADLDRAQRDEREAMRAEIARLVIRAAELDAELLKVLDAEEVDLEGELGEAVNIRSVWTVLTLTLSTIARQAALHPAAGIEGVAAGARAACKLIGILTRDIGPDDDGPVTVRRR